MVVECPGSSCSGSVLPGRECLVETTVFVRETGSLSPVLSSLSPFQDLIGERKFLKILEPFQPRKCHILRQFVDNQPRCRLIIWLIVDVSSQTQASYKLQEEVQCFDSI